MDIFSSEPGAVTAIASPGFPPIAFFLDGWGGQAFNALISKVGVGQRGGYQFLHSLSDFIYLTVFGERMGQMQISGLTYGTNCQKILPGRLPQSHGFEWVNQFYQYNRVTVRAAPILVVVGTSSPFLGFLLDSSISLDDPERGLGQFTLNLGVVPNRGLQP